MNEDNKIIKNFIIILTIVLAVTIALYFITKYAVKKDTSSDTSTTETTETSISYDTCIVGNMLNKNEAEYYVIIYNSNDSNATTYSGYVTSYKALDNHLAVYTVDLSNSLNEKYYSAEETNTTSTNINDLKFGDITLLKIKDGKIDKSYQTAKDIKKVWKLS